MKIKKALKATFIGLAALVAGEFWASNVNIGTVSPSEAFGYAHNVAKQTAFYPATFIEVAGERYAKHGDPVGAAAGLGAFGGFCAAPILLYTENRKKKKKEE